MTSIGVKNGERGDLYGEFTVQVPRGQPLTYPCTPNKTLVPARTERNRHCHRREQTIEYGLDGNTDDSSPSGVPWLQQSRWQKQVVETKQNGLPRWGPNAGIDTTSASRLARFGNNVQIDGQASSLHTTPARLIASFDRTVFSAYSQNPLSPRKREPRREYGQ